MPHLIFFEDESAIDLLPLTFTRPIYFLRVGIELIETKWMRFFSHETQFGYQSRNYLKPKFQKVLPNNQPILYINGKILPDNELVEFIKKGFSIESVLLNNNAEIIAFYSAKINLQQIDNYVTTKDIQDLKPIQWKGKEINAIRQLPDIFRLNAQEIKKDIVYYQKHCVNHPITDKHTIVYNPENVFVGKDVKMRAAILNAEDGPIFIGNYADIQEGSIIKGTHCIGEHSVIHPGTRLRGDSTIGPHCKVGGEIQNSVLFGYSNKGHDGYLGNSIIGEWCNLGAGTTTSNLKNNYSNVQIYNYKQQKIVNSGLQFCGLIIGDHSKAGIQTMFNTGTVVGVCCNIFDAGFPPKHIPSFSWGGKDGFEKFKFEKALELAQKVMQRRGIQLTEADIEILKEIESL